MMNKIFTFKVYSVLIPVLLCCIALLIYALNIDGEFVYDDVTYFIENDVITKASPFDFSTLFLTSTNLWGEVLPFRDFLFITQYKAFGDWTTGYHLFSMFLFCCSYLVLFKLILTLVKDYMNNTIINNHTEHDAWLITLMVTSLFLFHPTYVEVFAYISGQKDAISLLFILLTISYFYKVSSSTSNYTLPFFLGVLFHYLAILSKLSALSSILFIPIILLVINHHPIKKRLQFIAIWLLANVPVVLWFLHTTTLEEPYAPLSNAVPLFESIPRAINVIGCHVSHIFKPWPLNMGYPFNNNFAFDSNFFIGILFIGLFSVIAIKKRNALIVFGLCIFVFYLASCLQIYPDMPNDKIYDRYLAIPFIGLLIALIPLLYFFISKGKLWKRLVIIFFVIISSVLGFLTSLYVPVFQSNIKVLGHTYKYFPEKQMYFPNNTAQTAFFNYVNMLINERKLDEAEELISINTTLSTINGEKNYVIGRIFMERREFYTAIEFFRTSSRESDLNDSFNFADGPLAMIYMLLGRYDEAEPLLLKTIKNNGDPLTTSKAKSMLEELKSKSNFGTEQINNLSSKNE